MSSPVEKLDAKKSSNKTVVIIIALVVVLLSLCALCVGIGVVLTLINSANEKAKQVADGTVKADYIYSYEIPLDMRSVYDEIDNLQSQGKYEEAAPKIEEALSKVPNEDAFRYLKCYNLYHLFKYDEAKIICAEVADRNMANPIIISQTSLIFWDSNDCDGAVKYALQSTKITDIDEEDQRRVYGNAGIILADCKQHTDIAKQMLEKALELSGKDGYESKYVYQEYLDGLVEENETK